jgi:uncharacterized protein YbbC (DUF1343 family)
MQKVSTGLDRLIASDFDAIQGRRVGLLTHSAAIDAQWRSTIEVFAQSPSALVSLFGPEHGLHGQAQDLIGVTADESQSITRVISLYGTCESSLHPTREMFSDLDVLVVDLQDIGSRYYTYQATMLYCLQIALPMGLDVLVLDRPNPIGGIVVEGPRVRQGFESFVGAFDIATRHGMTIGELALYYATLLNLDLSHLQVITCSGWKRRDHFDETGCPWVLPSPNMPTLDTALVYPGQCLFEGTNLSEGRGTTKPFEICGAPWIDANRIARDMNGLHLPGVVFRPVWFRPTFQKHVGQDCGGVQLHVTDRSAYRSLETSLALLIAMRHHSGDLFRWRTEIYEFVDEPIAIDLLFGSDRERLAIEENKPCDEIVEAWKAEESAFAHARTQSLLYE